MGRGLQMPRGNVWNCKKRHRNVRFRSWCISTLVKATSKEDLMKVEEVHEKVSSECDVSERTTRGVVYDAWACLFSLLTSVWMIVSSLKEHLLIMKCVSRIQTPAFVMVWKAVWETWNPLVNLCRRTRQYQWQRQYFVIFHPMHGCFDTLVFIAYQSFNRMGEYTHSLFTRNLLQKLSFTIWEKEMYATIFLYS